MRRRPLSLECDRHGAHHPVRPLGLLPVVEAADDAVRRTPSSSVLSTEMSPARPMASLRALLAFDERLARLLLLERPAVLDEPRDSEYAAVEPRVVDQEVAVHQVATRACPGGTSRGAESSPTRFSRTPSCSGTSSAGCATWRSSCSGAHCRVGRRSCPGTGRRQQRDRPPADGVSCVRGVAVNHNDTSAKDAQPPAGGRSGRGSRSVVAPDRQRCMPLALRRRCTARTLDRLARGREGGVMKWMLGC